MLVSIALTAAIQYARRAPAQNVSTRRNAPRPETRPTGPRPRHIASRPRRDVSTSRDRLEIETSRPRPHPCCICCFARLSYRRGVCSFVSCPCKFKRMNPNFMTVGPIVSRRLLSVIGRIYCIPSCPIGCGKSA